MNGFLVLLRSSADDYPLSLHATREAAEEAAQRVADDPEAALAKLEEQVGHGVPVSSLLLSADVMEFADGLPVRLDTLAEVEL
jgi:hypothetical protein